MSKKILDVTVTVIFCTCLIVSSNIQEKDAGRLQRNTETYSEQHSTAEENNAVTAGVCLILSQHSFTTESDEKTEIERKEVIRVTSPQEILSDCFAGGYLPHTELSEQVVIANHISNTTEDAPKRELAAEETAAEEPQQETQAAKEAAVQEVTAEPVYANRWGITLTEEEIDLLARIVWLESCGEPVLGQEAVVEVVFNRMASDLYPDTLYDVLSQRNPVQFCSWKNRGTAEPTEKEYQSIYQVLNGNTSILRNDTMNFSTYPLTPNLDVKIGGHSFCY